MTNIDLTTSITRIETLSGQPRGTGFLIAPTLAVTCGHVVEACGVGAGGQVRVVFRAGGAAAIEAEVLADGWHLDEDVAFLRLAGALPEGVKPAVLGASAGQQGKPVRVFGYPNLGDIEGLWGDGRLVGPVTTWSRWCWVSWGC